jgi:uncharacterized protein with HEPN domain
MRRDGVLLANRLSADVEHDPDRRDALLWNFTVLGEAVGQLSDELKDDHPEIGWASPIRMRNRIVHGYWSIDFDVLVTTARDDLGGFLEAVRGLLDAQPDSAATT